MPYCAKCGVEVKNGKKRCPLCKFPIPKIDDEIAELNYPGIERKKAMSNREVRLLTWQILLSFFIISFFVVLVTDLITNKGITWSAYPMIGISLAIFVTTFIIFFFRKPLVIIICNCASTVMFLFFLDLFDSRVSWFLNLGLPIWAMITVIIVVAYILISALKKPGFNVAGIILILIGAFCMGLEMLITAFLGIFSLKWSFIVLAVLIPLGVLFITYHYVFAKKYDVRKLFHV